MNRLRQVINRFIMWQWKKMSRISAELYKLLDSAINGNDEQDH